MAAFLLSSTLAALCVYAMCKGVIFVQALNESNMKVLFFGEVLPPAPGEVFDRRFWLQSTMPSRHSQCVTPSTLGDADLPGDECNCTCILAQKQACRVMNLEHYVWSSYPPDGNFNSSFERMEIGVCTSGTFTLRLMNINDKVVFTVVLGAARSSAKFPSGGRDTQPRTTTPRGLNNANRFWVTYNGGKLQVGEEGRGEILECCSSVNSTSAIWRTEMQFPMGGEMHIYSPCY